MLFLLNYQNKLKVNNILPKPNIKAIVIDLGGVLYRLNIKISIGDFSWLFRRYTRQIEQIYYSKSHVKLMQGKIELYKFYKELLKLFVRTEDFAPYDKFEEIWKFMIGDIIDDVFQIIRQLRQLYPDLIIALCSNIDRAHWKVAINNYDIRNEFDHIFLSYELGCIKPDKEILRIIINTVNVAPSQIVFIDDTDRNILAALDMGLYGILVPKQDKHIAIKAGLQQLGIDLKNQRTPTNLTI